MNKYLPVLKNCPLFKNLSDEDIVNSLKCMNAQLIKKKDEYIIHAGSTIDSIGLIVQGSALIVQDDLWGNRNIVGNLSPGNFYGEPLRIYTGYCYEFECMSRQKTVRFSCLALTNCLICAQIHAATIMR